ncbi:response regulator transcription factor [Aestuariibacter salexigens]|uniref:response regulator transcription factor n=1 Tax=Aestuariibacter salexigens TaxID=226010 RepID=UPI0003F4F0FE|nr:response regulator transcription factor [Aestuariibacter salexigens]
MKILLIEDNPTIAQQIVEFLSGHNWHVDYAHNGQLGIQLAVSDIFDVVLLDLNLPDMDGLQVCEAIKQNAKVTPPVLMVTARDRFEDKSAGFHQGADDYLTKPFDLRELALRCQALARRDNLHQHKKIEVGELSIDLTARSASRAGETLALTHVGFELLVILAQHFPQPVSRSLILHKLWADAPPDSDALKSHIYSLRQELDKSFAYPMLKTVMNLGYQLVVDK